ncbi:MAG: hypothetical protein ACD_3C00030G0003 [uncultured bacterium (gcode 4)]|uniref:Transcription regulator TrmB N-terminal domain-containing protein n=1 Tax=uncultured bacterium (gcode 4) TaxID=1234023 RepID=K2G330_9BACT|nr:MAG: hypothetical protein ACD_3C00030G0003 [uncultured bacterium (gcode 4)]
MQKDLIEKLKQYWLTEKESRVYLFTLEIWTSIVSAIARRCSINRTSTYEILSSLKNKWIAIESTKDDVKYYSVVAPELLLSQLEQKYNSFKESLPSFLAVMWNWWNKPKIGYYDWIEWLKMVFGQVLKEGYSMNSPYLSFMGTNIEIDPKLSEYLKNEFSQKRLNCPIKTHVIASSKNSSEYLSFNLKTHESLIIDDDLFEMWNEIVIYWENKVAVLMYAKNEQSGLIIESKTLHDWLRSLFKLIWKSYKKTC